MSKCEVTGQNLSDIKLYSEKDISEYLKTYLKRSLCGDCFDGSPWGEEENKQLYLAIFALPDWLSGITARTVNSKRLPVDGVLPITEDERNELGSIIGEDIYGQLEISGDKIKYHSSSWLRCRFMDNIIALRWIDERFKI